MPMNSNLKVGLGVAGLLGASAGIGALIGGGVHGTYNMVTGNEGRTGRWAKAGAIGMLLGGPVGLGIGMAFASMSSNQPNNR